MVMVAYCWLVGWIKLNEWLFGKISIFMPSLCGKSCSNLPIKGRRFAPHRTISSHDVAIAWIPSFVPEASVNGVDKTSTYNA